MQSRSRRGDRSPFVCVNSLIALAIPVYSCSVNIRRQRDVPQLLDLAEEIGDGLESQRTLAEFAVCDDLGAQRAVSKRKHFADEGLAPGSRENPPFPLGDLLGEEHLHATSGVMS